MKQLYSTLRYSLCLCVGSALLIFLSLTAGAQSCPTNAVSTLSTYPNTYFPGSSSSLSAGSTSITLGAASFGSTAISSGDVLLIIQMQGSEFNTTNNVNYGGGNGTGSGYYTSNFLAGKMEFVVATSAVPLSGGTLTIASGLKNAYRNTAYNTTGQYTYQILRVPMYNELRLTGTISPPAWNGTNGGVLVLYATDSISLNGQTIDASGLGFRGGGGRSLSGAGSGSSGDYITLSSAAANGSKGEGISGTPKYINNVYSSLITNSVEGYPSGSYARGAPGNAGGGGTDGNGKNSNDQNSGGGGGGNGGAGGIGGNSWSSNLAVGGKGGTLLAEVSPSRMVMGGGGGAGTTNNGTGTPNNGLASSGSAGGGIIILMANQISGPGSILANGSAANATVQNDGAGGGGAGGSILLYSKLGNMTGLTVSARGGAGGSNQINASDPHGPGGGGGGGIIYANSSLNAASSVAAGVAGTTNSGSSNFGASSGSDGVLSTTITQSQTPTFPVSCVILASSFIEINAGWDNTSARIKWTVSEDGDVLQYVIERSTDGSHFSTLATIGYTYSNTSSRAYSYSDENAASSGAQLYYRVKQVLGSGQFNYSKIVSLRTGDQSSTLSVYPNPVQSVLTVHFKAVSDGSVNLRLIDTKGSLVWNQVYTASAGQVDLSISAAGSLPDGIYILQVYDGHSSRQTKVLVRH